MNKLKIELRPLMAALGLGFILLASGCGPASQQYLPGDTPAVETPRGPSAVETTEPHRLTASDFITLPPPGSENPAPLPEPKPTPPPIIPKATGKALVFSSATVDKKAAAPAVKILDKLAVQAEADNYHAYVNKVMADLYAKGTIKSKQDEQSVFNYAAQNKILDLNQAAEQWKQSLENGVVAPPQLTTPDITYQQLYNQYYEELGLIEAQKKVDDLKQQIVEVRQEIAAVPQEVTDRLTQEGGGQTPAPAVVAVEIAAEQQPLVDQLNDLNAQLIAAQAELDAKIAALEAFLASAPPGDNNGSVIFCGTAINSYDKRAPGICPQ